MSRREALVAAHRQAREDHNRALTQHTFNKLRGAANTIKQYDEHLARLEGALKSAKAMYMHEKIANIEGKIRQHTITNGLESDVKLVDTAGTLRLDLNGRRTFMTRAQARELLIKLACGLDDGTYSSFGADCMSTPGDSVSIEPIEGGVSVNPFRENGGLPAAVNLRKDCAVSLAMAMIAFAAETEQ